MFPSVVRNPFVKEHPNKDWRNAKDDSDDDEDTVMNFDSMDVEPHNLTELDQTGLKLKDDGSCEDILPLDFVEIHESDDDKLVEESFISNIVPLSGDEEADMSFAKSEISETKSSKSLKLLEKLNLPKDLTIIYSASPRASKTPALTQDHDPEIITIEESEDEDEDEEDPSPNGTPLLAIEYESDWTMDGEAAIALIEEDIKDIDESKSHDKILDERKYKPCYVKMKTLKSHDDAPVDTERLVMVEKGVEEKDNLTCFEKFLDEKKCKPCFVKLKPLKSTANEESSQEYESVKEYESDQEFESVEQFEFCSTFWI